MNVATQGLRMIDILDHEFTRFQQFIFAEAGITLAASKKALVCGRLEKRLRQHKLGSYSDYLALLHSRRDPEEVQIAVDLLTTNETYFFREPRHFELLRELAQDATRQRHALKVWSAACASGEEPYSVAMVLADTQGDLPWEVLGSDISTRVLRRARIAHYPQERATHIPTDCLRRYCLKGTGVETGTLLVQRALRERVDFMQINLDKPLPPMGPFDLILVRNVMIYFSAETKRRVIQRLTEVLAPGGHLLIGHSETLNDIATALLPVAPSIYRKPPCPTR